MSQAWVSATNCTTIATNSIWSTTSWPSLPKGSIRDNPSTINRPFISIDSSMPSGWSILKATSTNTQPNNRFTLFAVWCGRRWSWWPSIAKKCRVSSRQASSAFVSWVTFETEIRWSVGQSAKRVRRFTGDYRNLHRMNTSKVCGASSAEMHRSWNIWSGWYTTTTLKLCGSMWRIREARCSLFLKITNNPLFFMWRVSWEGRVLPWPSKRSGDVT